MKILYVSERLNADDGSAVHGREFVNALRQLGHQVVTYPPIAQGGASPSAAASGEGDKGSLPGRIYRRLKHMAKASNPYVRDVIDVASGYFKSRASARELLRIVRAEAPALIVYRFVLFDFSANLLRRKTELPMVVEINAIKSIEVAFGSASAVTPLTRWGDSMAHAPADGITVVSSAIRDVLLRQGVSKPIAVVENGVSLEKFQPDPARKAEMKARYGLTDRTTLGYVGSYKGWHGLGDTLRITRALVDMGLPVHLVLIGSGSDEARFNRQKEQLGLTAHVTQIPALPHDQVADHMHVIDIALMSYPKIEPFWFSPLKLFEYLAAGMPVVASRLGQIEEVLEGQAFGRLVEPEDIDGFVQALAPIVEREHLRESMGAAARRWAEGHCSWQNNARKVLRLSEAAAQFRRRCVTELANQQTRGN